MPVEKHTLLVSLMVRVNEKKSCKRYHPAVLCTRIKPRLCNEIVSQQIASDVLLHMTHLSVRVSRGATRDSSLGGSITWCYT